MFFVFSKLLNFSISPINWVIVLLVVSLIIKRRRLKQGILALSVAIALLFTNGPLLQTAVKAWSKPYNIPLDTARVYEFAIVAGGSVGYSPDWRQVDFNDRADRITEAIRLYRLGKIRKLYLSGESAFNLIHGISYAPQFLQYMKEMGVNPEDIILEQHARTTRENILNLKKFLTTQNTDTPILMITSGWHMRRLMKGFAGSGLHLVPYGVDVPSPTPTVQWEDFIPSWKTARGWQELIHELVGWMVI